ANTGPGRIVLTLPGTTYTPGARQRITVRVEDPNQRRWGFQVTARVVGSLKTQAGSFTPVDSFTQVLCSNANLVEQSCNSPLLLQFIEHTLSGSRPNTTVGATFEFDWTPPASNVGSVIFYAAGNAANNNAENTGDRIYTTNQTITFAAGGGGPRPTISSLENGGTPTSAAFAQNTWVAIKGSNLATTTRIWEGRDFNGNNLPTQLDGTSVKINNKDALSPGQVNVLAPLETALGNVQVQVSTPGGSSDPVTGTIQQFAPAFFVVNGDSPGNKYIAARHLDFSLVGPATLFPGATTPARPGEVISLYGTGFGETNPPIPGGQIVTVPGTLTTMPVIRMGGVNMDVSFAGQSATGLYQFNVTIPESAPAGDQAVVAEIGGVSTQAGAFITVQR
ncbi:MAG: choice-of-anchor V domain-containing protein, partial [Bryobacteraceae bacterium]